MPKMNKTVLITGGSGGLGTAVTSAFFDTGAAVYVSYIVDQEAADLKIANENHQNLHCIKTDLTDETSVKNLFKEISGTQGQLDVLANLIGGFWMGGDISETPLENWNHMIKLNLTTAFLCVREAFAAMKAAGGNIITVSAKAAQELPAGMAAYTTSKAAVLALTETVAKEGAPFNIRANAILPGIIDTETNRRAMPDADFSKWVAPADIAKTIVSLSSDAAGAVSGTAVKVYGNV